MSSAAPILTPTPTPSGRSGAFPVLVFVQGGEQRQITLDHTPFTVGRKTDKNLVIADARVSRDHAEIIAEGGDFFVVDVGSKHGTFVNGQRVERRKLMPDDRIEFGMRDGAFVLFNPAGTQASTAREFLSQIHGLQVRADASDLEKLTLFLNAARKLNTSGVLEEVLITLIETTLRVTGAERGYVFLRQPDGSLKLAAGRNAKGQTLVDDSTISHSIVEEAAHSASSFLVTDTTKNSALAGRQSIVAYDLRTVICIPLRRGSMQQQAGGDATTLGVLYMDSRFTSKDISNVSQDILGAIATEAASLVENANLAAAEEQARRLQQEMAIAAAIQQRLMSVTIPEVPFASLNARNLPCRDIGGDFFDVVMTKDGLTVVITDVCGKGVSAAILASILQGMIYAQAVAGVPLHEIVTGANRFLCEKSIGEKYATVFVARLSPSGELEFVNCGHVPPVLVSNGSVARIEESNLPVGLLHEASYQAGQRKLAPGDRLVLVTDGVTEAENSQGEFFGDERLERAAASENAFDNLFSSIREFCRETPLGDDCTVVELIYRA
ncbi:MAG TPA: SpoIIE family protein phosphatase [Terriglobales bacterium]|nr:SpoIIE family protein phosphatase [Terriglobales bacterium]